MRSISVNDLKPNKINPNQLNEEQYEKLKENIRLTGRYPSLIVRSLNDKREGKPDVSVAGGKKTETFEIIDGYHRWCILKELGYKEVDCEVWNVDDKGVALLLATLNRLRGTDDHTKRAKLLAGIYMDFGEEYNITKLIPESDRSLLALINTLKSDGEIDIESEQGLIEEQLLQSGVDHEAAKRIASKHKLPGEKATMRFVFFDDKSYNKAVKTFGVKPNTQKLIELIDKYGSN